MFYISARKVMDTEAIYKALANPIRRQILQCLKDPEQFIPKLNECEYDFSRGVCAGQIEKLPMSLSRLCPTICQCCNRQD